MTSQNLPPPAWTKALPAPGGEITVLDDDLLSRVLLASRQSPRGRIILPLHQAAQEPLQRMLNAIQPASYIPPHRHLHPPKAESILVLRGTIRFVLFSSAGGIRLVKTLAAGTTAFGIDCAAGSFHTFWALAADTVVFEVKPGPYEEASDKDFASWAPREGDSRAAAYQCQLAESASRWLDHPHSPEGGK